MGALEIAKMIEGYTDGNQRYIDELKLGEPYVVKGIFMDGPDDVERLEVGMLGKKPLVQIMLGDVPEYENREGSYLDIDRYSGTMWGPKGDKYTNIEMSLLN